VAQDITDDYGPLRQEHEYVLQNESNTFSKSNRYAFLLFIYFCLLCFASHRAMAKVFVIVREVCPNMQLP